MAEKRDILAEARDWWISYCTNIAELLEYADLMNIRDSDVVRNRLSELQRMNDPNVYEPAPPNPYEGRDILQEAIQWYVNYCTNSQELIDYAEDMGIRNSELVNNRLFDVRNPYGLEFLETSYTDINDLMDSQSESVEYRVNSFDSAEELMNYAAVMGIQESPMVINRLRHLQRPDKYNDSLGAIVESFAYYTGGSLITLGDKSSSPPFNDVRTTDISQESDYICFTNDKTMENSENIEDDEPLAGTSHHRGKLNFTMREKSKRTYKKYMAVDTCYEVKIDEQYNGQNLMDIQEGLEDLLETVLERARGDLADNDLVRVIIEHQALQDAIVVPLQRWDELTVQKLLEHIMRVLNSNQQLTIDHSFTIFIGTINLPKGGKRRRITNIAGKKRKNSLHLKRSVVTIENKDNLCMARAIGVSWSKLNKCSQLEWNAIASNRQGKSNLELILEHKMVPRSYFSKLIDKKRQAQTKLALALCQKAGVNTQHPLSLNDVEAFEKLLGVRVMVVSARLGNKFVTSGASDERPCIYIYLVDDEHFHAITSITGFFSSIYFCQKCLKHYNEKKNHSCEIKCIVCKRDSCSMKESVRCSDCNMTCRSADCYIEHKKRPVTKKGPHKGKPCGPSQCSTWWKCPACCKVVDLRNRSKESHVCGEYWCESCNQFVFDDHQCYLRPIPCKEEHIPKFIFFDFECSQDEKSFCEDGYLPSIKADCQHCKLPDLCQSCSKCSHCKTSWCGKNTHRPNFVVAHTVCQKCIEKDVKPNSRCKSCGTRCEICEKTDEKKSIDPCPDTCGFREVIFQGSDTAEKFGEWLFSDQHEYFTVIAHNMRAYDGFPLLEYLINQSIRPEKVIYNGCKIMLLMAERGLHIKVLDSLNFLPMKLAKLPEAFGLTELKKGWFPHFFNTRENQNYVGPYPAAKYYGADSMSNKERGKLIRWLKAKRRKNCIFNFREEMEEYCRSDVDILRKACLKFRHLLMSVTGEQVELLNDKGKIERKWVGAVDPFHSVTLAGVDMNLIRQKFLDEEWRVRFKGSEDWVPAKKVNGTLYIQRESEWVRESSFKDQKVESKEFVSTHIAKISPHGLKDQFSKISIAWLEWVSRTQNIRIQHALNEGEKTIPGTRYKLDGFCAETNTCYEYHSCFWHGCVLCYDTNRSETYHPVTHQSVEELYSLTMKKKSYLENLGMNYICIWDHDFKKQIDENPDLKQFVSELDITERLDPRDSFFGGRTNASRLYYKAGENEKIRYVDFTSLYPWVNKYAKYPSGHPTIITNDFGDIENYFGIAKIKVLPPKGLYHPVLPYRSNGKLKFPLCRQCADTESQLPCKCADKQRELIGTWCLPEIKVAVRLGYRITKIYEIYHWDKTTQYDPETREGGLFAKFIDTFLKIKQEASGFPDWAKSRADRDRYVREYLEKEGISLDRQNIVPNPGLRALAKLVLNSCWGKFGQRLNMKQTSFFHESEADLFFQLLTCPLKNPLDFHIMTDDIIQVEWEYQAQCQPSDDKTNIYLATFTTCWARLKLYDVLEKLQRNVIYFDTDSLVYISRPGEYDPPLGDFLGELTNELGKDEPAIHLQHVESENDESENDESEKNESENVLENRQTDEQTDANEIEEYITEFVSGGPKNYAYRTNKDKESCKVRGFTLNFVNSRLINFESVKQMVTGQDDSSESQTTPSENDSVPDSENRSTISVTNPNKMCRNKRKCIIYNRKEEKNYQVVYTKRRRIDNFDTEPYGY